MSQDRGYDRLVAHRIKPSVQRLAVINYLIGNKNHPTVDMIFQDLYPSIPTLSRTTVYNTLKLLVEQGAIQMLSIDDKNSRFDADITPHAHFRCNGCGCIKDLDLSGSSITDKYDNLTITEIQLYYKGYCRQCLGNVDKENMFIH